MTDNIDVSEQAARIAYLMFFVIVCLFIIILAVLAIGLIKHFVLAATSETIPRLSEVIIDTKDQDSFISCDDEFCIKDIKAAMLDETLNLKNSTNLILMQPHKIRNEANQSFPQYYK